MVTRHAFIPRHQLRRAFRHGLVGADMRGAKVNLGVLGTRGASIDAALVNRGIPVDEFGTASSLGMPNTTVLGDLYPTLAAAQGDYPEAVALTDTLDWCAWQQALKSGLKIRGRGVYRLNRTLAAANQFDLSCSSEIKLIFARDGAYTLCKKPDGTDDNVRAAIDMSGCSNSKIAGNLQLIYATPGNPAGDDVDVTAFAVADDKETCTRLTIEYLSIVRFHSPIYQSAKTGRNVHVVWTRSNINFLEIKWCRYSWYWGGVNVDDIVINNCFINECRHPGVMKAASPAFDQLFIAGASASYTPRVTGARGEKTLVLSQTSGTLPSSGEAMGVILDNGLQQLVTVADISGENVTINEVLDDDVTAGKIERADASGLLLDNSTLKCQTLYIEKNFRNPPLELVGSTPVLEALLKVSEGGLVCPAYTPIHMNSREGYLGIILGPDHGSGTTKAIAYLPDIQDSRPAVAARHVRIDTAFKRALLNEEGLTPVLTGPEIYGEAASSSFSGVRVEPSAQLPLPTNDNVRIRSADGECARSRDVRQFVVRNVQSETPTFVCTRQFMKGSADDAIQANNRYGIAHLERMDAGNDRAVYIYLSSGAGNMFLTPIQTVNISLSVSGDDVLVTHTDNSTIDIAVHFSRMA